MARCVPRAESEERPRKRGAENSPDSTMSAIRQACYRALELDPSCARRGRDTSSLHDAFHERTRPRGRSPRSAAETRSVPAECDRANSGAPGDDNSWRIDRHLVETHRPGFRRGEDPVPRTGRRHPRRAVRESATASRSSSSPPARGTITLTEIRSIDVDKPGVLDARDENPAPFSSAGRAEDPSVGLSSAKPELPAGCPSRWPVQLAIRPGPRAEPDERRDRETRIAVATAATARATMARTRLILALLMLPRLRMPTARRRA